MSRGSVGLHLARHAPAAEAAPQAPSLRERTPRARLWKDKLARWIVTAGGLAVIAGILGILVFIVIEVLPLAAGARVSAGRSLDIDPAGADGAMLVADEHRAQVAVLAASGRAAVREIDGGRVVAERDLGAVTAVSSVPGQPVLTAATARGEVLALPVRWRISFDGQRRVTAVELPEPVAFAMDPAGGTLGPFAVQTDDDGPAAAAAVLADGSVALVARTRTTNLFTEQTTESWSRLVLAAPSGLSALVLDGPQRNLYGGTTAGQVVWWSLASSAPAPVLVGGGSSGITALSLLLGERSLLVGRDDGAIEVWFNLPESDGRSRPRRIRQFAGRGAAIAAFAPSLRDKSFLALDRDAGVGLFHTTSGRTLWTGAAPLAEAAAVYFAPKADAALFAGPSGLAELEIDNPHPEVSLRSLFAKIWYEDHPGPQWVWQSSGGTDEFEPKLSLTPLIVGTLKGTLYSLLLAIPLGVLAALYTAQFMHPSLRRYVKPTVEIMAALPSVVLGFLAGLWLAPRVEAFLPALILMHAVLPVLVVTTGLGWRRLPRGWRGLFPAGAEVVAFMLVLACGIALCLALNGACESVFFGGDFSRWLFELTGLRYDQRNAIVVGLAMGFAVIPIIFSIAEDAFSNVPANLVSGSLALGASRWQTATRVVVPTASPGIFSAIMIGFGRAVGETMIVLMATGNTPVLDWNPFNGFRTLSANIAVEIPEAPQGGTLYRTLFLAALLLFVMTFVINTAAELVRQRLRKRYAHL